MLPATLTLAIAVSQPSIDARLLRFPDIHEDKIVFTYAGDLWLVSDQGGVARRLTTHPGNEYIGKFSPDGQHIAFSASYDGNIDVYVMPSEGGEPRRLTFHPGPDLVLDWMPDGKSVMFRSTRESYNDRFLKAFTVPVEGGTATPLPMNESGLASPSPDGSVIAYNRFPTENAAWKRYRGGFQSFISFFDTRNIRYWEMERDDSAYLWPMWVDHRVFYANDSDGILNLYSYDTRTRRQTRHTNYRDLDVRWPSHGPGKIVYERDGRLWALDLAQNTTRQVPVRILTDAIRTRPHRIRLGDRPGHMSISPNAVRLSIEARGELFSVPVKEGVTENLTNTPGARERYPEWSPDGKWILYAGDESGEYEYYVRLSDLSQPAERLTADGARFRNAPTWSPDSSKFLFTEVDGTLHVYDMEAKTSQRIGQHEYPAFSDAVWSPDSKWLAYTKTDSTGFGKIHLYSLEDGRETKISSGMFDDYNPMFDPDGKYLYFVSARDFNPMMSVFELTFNMVDAERIYGWTLHTDTRSPFAPKDEREALPADDEQEKPQQEKEEPKPWDLEGMDERIFRAPVPAGSYRLIATGPGRIFYRSGPSVRFLDIATSQSQTIIETPGQVRFTPKRDRLAYTTGPVVGVIQIQPNQQVGAGRVRTDDMSADVDPRAEWEHSYWEAWRYQRDFFWAPNMAGIDWRAAGERYARWLPYVAHRSDLDYLLRELLGELATGHAYVIPAPPEGITQVPVGLLGADYERTAHGIRFKKIYRGHMWEEARRAPLNEPGMNVREGDYLISINEHVVTPQTDVDRLLVDQVNRLTRIRVNSVPSIEGAREILVRPTGSDTILRYADWVDGRRKYVEEKSGGRLGYVHVPSTGFDGVIEFHKMFYPQVDRQGLIVDERYNSGGFIPDFFVEKLRREHLVGWKPRDQASFRSPGAAVLGPKVMLINHYGGSGGDALPYFFRKLGIGPVIGTRTWGGLVGIMGGRDLMSGGAVTVPQFAIWDLDERGRPQWVVENIGVSPDIELDNRPDLVYRGQDPQLDRGIEVALDLLRRNPPPRMDPPPYPVRPPIGAGG